jgi:hypothetical protein
VTALRSCQASIASRMASALRAHDRATRALLRSPGALDEDIARATGADIAVVRRARQDLDVARGAR